MKDFSPGKNTENVPRTAQDLLAERRANCVEMMMWQKAGDRIAVDMLRGLNMLIDAELASRR